MFCFVCLAYCYDSRLVLHFDKAIIVTNVIVEMAISHMHMSPKINVFHNAICLIINGLLKKVSNVGGALLFRIKYEIIIQQ